jgi:multiple sugar transport system ATP-binding protein
MSRSSNLDAKLRLEMRAELQRLHADLGATFVYVTHDQLEAMTLATKICLINNGVLQQYDAPLNVYRRPANLFVADFVGNPSINFIEAKGHQNKDGTFSFTYFKGKEKFTFTPAKAFSMDAWRKGLSDEIALRKTKHWPNGERRRTSLRKTTKTASSSIGSPKSKKTPSKKNTCRMMRTSS